MRKTDLYQLKGNWVLWWVDLGCLPDAHQVALSLPFLTRTRGRK